MSGNELNSASQKIGTTLGGFCINNNLGGGLLQTKALGQPCQRNAVTYVKERILKLSLSTL